MRPAKVATISTIFLVMLGCSDPPIRNTVDQIQIEVALEIDYQGEGENISTTRMIAKNSTVLELMLEAKLDDQLFDFQYRGEGETAFVSSIGGVENQKSGGSNWIFFLNEELASASCGAIRLNNGDTVKWSYLDNYQPE